MCQKKKKPSHFNDRVVPIENAQAETKWWTELLEGLACPSPLWAARRGRIISGRLAKRLRSLFETSTQSYRGEVIGPKYTPNDYLFDEVVSLRGRCRNSALGRAPWEMLQLAAILYMRVKSSLRGRGGGGYSLIIGMCGAKEYHGFLGVLD